MVAPVDLLAVNQTAALVEAAYHQGSLCSIMAAPARAAVAEPAARPRRRARRGRRSLITS